MPILRTTDTPSQTERDPADPGDRDANFETLDAHLEGELERAERRMRWEREHPIFGVHPDGFGPTLGQDLGKPNPGHDADWNDESYDPPT